MSPLLPHPPSISTPRPRAVRGRTLPAPAQPSGTATWAPRRQPGWALAALALHGALVWALLQSPVLQRALQAATPVMVSVISAPAPALPPAPAGPLLLRQRSMALPHLAAVAIPAVRTDPAPERAPPVAAAAAQPAAAPPAPATPAVVVDAAPAAAPAAAASHPLTQALPGPKAVPAGALRYAVAPAIEVPMASRRLQESGTVWLRVVFDASGTPRQVTLHKSSGFARLDDQAQQAMRQARITPPLDNGVAVEVLATAPLRYELD